MSTDRAAPRTAQCGLPRDPAAVTALRAACGDAPWWPADRVARVLACELLGWPTVRHALLGGKWHVYGFDVLSVMGQPVPPVHMAIVGDAR